MIGERTLKSYPNENLTFASMISEKSSGYERSYFQYKEQTSRFPKTSLFILEISSIFFFLLICISGIINIFVRKKGNSYQYVFHDTNASKTSYDNHLQEHFGEQFIKLKSNFLQHKVNSNTLIEFITALKLSGSFYFSVKIFYKTSLVEFITFHLEPTRIYSTSEFSFASSWLTEFLNKKNISHWNVMHGDKIYNTRDTYCKFDGVVIWDETYLDLFKSLKWTFNTHLTFVPELKAVSSDSKNKTIAYFLSANPSNIGNFENTIEKLLDLGFVVVLYEHPKKRNNVFIQKLVAKHKNNEFLTVTIKEENTAVECDLIVSQYSSVLVLAYLHKIPFAFDDLSEFSQDRLERSGLKRVSNNLIPRLSELAG